MIFRCMRCAVGYLTQRDAINCRLKHELDERAVDYLDAKELSLISFMMKHRRAKHENYASVKN